MRHRLPALGRPRGHRPPDAGDPQAALILYLKGPYLEYDWGHLVGDAESPSFRRFVPELLADHLPAGGAFLFPSSEGWRAQLDALFHRNFGRLIFKYPTGGLPRSIADLQVPVGFTVEAMSAASAERHGSPRHGGVRDPRESFGFCVMQGEEWTSHCYSQHIGGGDNHAGDGGGDHRGGDEPKPPEGGS